MNNLSTQKIDHKDLEVRITRFLAGILDPVNDRPMALRRWREQPYHKGYGKRIPLGMHLPECMEVRNSTEQGPSGALVWGRGHIKSSHMPPEWNRAASHRKQSQHHLPDLTALTSYLPSKISRQPQKHFLTCHLPQTSPSSPAPTRQS